LCQGPPDTRMALMAGPPRVSRAAAGLPRRRSGRPRKPPTPPPAAACLCEGHPRGLRVAIYVEGETRAELIAGFWAEHRGGTHTPVVRLPEVKGQGDPK
jgi:hypothetical protein